MYNDILSKEGEKVSTGVRVSKRCSPAIVTPKWENDIKQTKELPKRAGSRSGTNSLHWKVRINRKYIKRDGDWVGKQGAG
jgi:hypothetical protein